MSDHQIDRLLAQVARLAALARSCIRHRNTVDARRYAARAQNLLSLIHSARLVQAVQSLRLVEPTASHVQ